MDFVDGLKELSEKLIKLKDKITTEEATKTAFVMPFFDLLGYDTRNPLEFMPEYVADVGDKKGEKVDYTIIIDGQPQILIEAKWCGKKLDIHNNQLVRYFTVTNAKIAILTNGIVYEFYTDLEETNKMDKKPFLVVDMLNIKDSDVVELKKFFKSNFNIDNILSTAEVLKYSNAIKRLLLSQFDEPNEYFVDYILSQVYEGRKTQNVKDKFADITKKSISQVINDMVRTKLENALATKEEVQEDIIEDTQQITPEKKINTTDEEISGYYIVKSIFAEFTNSERISYKDTTNYFGIILDNSIRKWVCRLHLNYAQKYIELPVYDEGKRVSENKFFIENVEGIYQYKKEFRDILSKIG